MTTRIEALKARAETAVRATVRAAGYELVKRHFYSPLPDVDALPESLWSTPNEMAGVDLRVEAAVALLRSDLRPYLAEFRPPRGRQESGRYYLDNDSYGTPDAELLYAIVRHAKPARVFELGSGASSHVIAAAAAINASEGRPVAHEIFDPYPFTASPLGPIRGPVIHATRAEEIEVATIQQLRGGDILFVDTTHTVKTGGDVTRIFLDLVPHVPSGTWIHVHDIFLPDEYPRRWVVEGRYAWAEQYLLQAFLAYNDAFEVVLPLNAVAQAAPDVLADVVSGYAPHFEPGAFWMRRR